MAHNRSTYTEKRPKMQPGDIIAFGGKGNFSEIIKWATRSTVSHVGIILQSKLLVDEKPQKGFFNDIIESTSLNGFSGVVKNRLSERISDYEGEIWWLPLSETARAKLDFEKFYTYLFHQQGRKYDTVQAIKSALDQFDKTPLFENLTENREDFSKFFCSELATAGLEVGGVINNINASEVTPIDLCRFNLYANEYFQLKGDTKKINGYNSLSPEGFGI